MWFLVCFLIKSEFCLTIHSNQELMGACVTSSKKPYKPQPYVAPALPVQFHQPDPEKLVSFSLKELPPEVTLHMQKEAKKEQKEKEWLEQEEKRVSHDRGSHNMRKMLLLVQRIGFYYQAHDLDSSMQCVGEFEELFQQVRRELNLSEEGMAATIQTELQLWKSQTSKSGGEAQEEHEVSGYEPGLIKQIKREHSAMTKVVDSVESGGWEEQQRHDGLVIYTRREQDDASVGALVEVDYHVPFEIFLTLMGEPGLFNQFVPNMEESREERKVARNAKIGYEKINLPVVAYRESFCLESVYSRLRTHGEVFMMSESLVTNEQLQRDLNYTVIKSKDCVQLKYKYMMARYFPIGQGHGRLVLGTNVDFGMNFLPFFMKELVVVRFAKDLLESIEQTSKRFTGSVWEQRIREDPDCFTFFKSEVSAYLQAKNQPYPVSSQ